MNHMPLQCRIMRQTLSTLTFLPHLIKTYEYLPRLLYSQLEPQVAQAYYESPAEQHYPT